MDNTQSDIQITPTGGDTPAAAQKSGGATPPKDNTQGQQQAKPATPQAIQLPEDVVTEAS